MAAIPSMTGGAGGAASTGPLTGGQSSFDASGWNVNYGSGALTSSRSDPKSYLPYLLAAGAVLFFVLRRK